MRPSERASAVPPPYQLAIEELGFVVTQFDPQAARDPVAGHTVSPPAWFAVELTSTTRKRYLYVVQHEAATGMIVVLLLVDRSPGGAEPVRLPAAAGWLRAVVAGPVYVLASDLMLSQRAITAWAGASAPPSPACPPYG